MKTEITLNVLSLDSGIGTIVLFRPDPEREVIYVFPVRFRRFLHNGEVL